MKKNGKKTKATDSFLSQDALLRLSGIGGPGRMTGRGRLPSHFENREELEARYVLDWLSGRIVDSVSEDMTREGISIEGVEDESLLQAELVSLGVWDSLTDIIRWSRLFGGAIGVLVIDGQDMSTPLLTDRISRGQFSGIQVYDRFDVTKTPEDEMYRHKNSGLYEIQVEERFSVHSSRVIRMDGIRLPRSLRQQHNGWGCSVLVRSDEAIIRLMDAMRGTSKLVSMAHLRSYFVEGLRSVLSSDKATEGLMRHLIFLAKFQDNFGLSIGDSTDKFETHSYGFAGLSETLLRFEREVSAASMIPISVLYGSSASGLNPSGEEDRKSYHEWIGSLQESKLRSGMTSILKVAHPSVFGRTAPEETSFAFVPLSRPTQKEKVEVAEKVTATISRIYESSIISHHTALRAIKASSEYTGVLTEITEKEIEEASLSPLPKAIAPPDEKVDNEDERLLEKYAAGV